MRINIAASHRFHLLDLAIELKNCGHDVRFYSYLPIKRAEHFGLPKNCSHSLFILMIPFLIMFKLSKGANWSVKCLHAALDCYLAYFMRPCDVYIALGTVYTKSLISAKRKFNAVTVLEWGSKHIVEQQKILEKLPDYNKQPMYFIKKSLLGYDLADYISIPSFHVKKSFVENNVPEKKIIQNPYGVRLGMFFPTELDQSDVYDLIMVGGWGYRKGCDLLADVCRETGLTLLHVGGLSDMDFPCDKNFRDVGKVEQSTLINWYKKARVFVLPSREEGLAMVQSQALVCGLPIVCSKHTGGADLKGLIVDKKWIIEMEELTLGALKEAIFMALELAREQKGIRSYCGKSVQEALSWTAYGKRYNNNIISMTNTPRG